MSVLRETRAFKVVGVRRAKPACELFEKHQEQVSRLSMRRIVARSIMVSEVRTMYS